MIANYQWTCMIPHYKWRPVNQWTRSNQCWIQENFKKTGLGIKRSQYKARGGRWPFWGSTDDRPNRVCFSRIFPSCGYHFRGEIPSCGGQFKGKIPRHGCNLTKSPYMRVMNYGFSQNMCMKWVPWTIFGSKCWVWDKISLDPGKLFRLDFP